MKKRGLIRGFGFLAAIVMAVCFAAFGSAGTAKEPSPPVTPALYVLSQRLGFDKSGLKGFTVMFTPDDFEEALGVSRLEEIVIRELPSASAGKLMLGNLEVMKNQSVSRANLGALRFIPCDAGVSGTSFRFEAGRETLYLATCTLHLLAEPNAAPTSAGVASDRFTVETFKNIAVYGTMPANDPEGDAMTFEVTEGPKQGLLVMLDRSSGEFVYTPTKNFVGKDGFTYTVTDENGNRSAGIRLSIEVSRSENGTVFEDLIGERAQISAVRLSDRGIMTGCKVGQQYIFEPEKPVSRSAFLVMAMRAAGLEGSPSENVTPVFSDFGSISPDVRGYVAFAFEKGYIEGIESDGMTLFDPERDVTVEEALVTVARILGLSTTEIKPVSGGEDSVAESETAAASLASAGFQWVGAAEETDRSLTRAQAAMLLADVMDFQKT